MPGKTIQSTEKAFDIIEMIAECGPANITEIADEVEYSRSTVHYHLKTLQQNRYVIRDEQGFRLGLHMAHLGNLSLRNHQLSGVVEKVADDLAAETGAISHVAVAEGNKLVWLYRSTGDDDPLPTGIGREVDMHCTAYGQAIMAYSAPEAVDELEDKYGLPSVTDQTLTDRSALDERLATIRDLGFAYSAEEMQAGFSSIAAPIIRDESGDVVGAIGISESANRIDDPYKHTKARRFSDELPGLVQQAARIAGDRLSDVK